MNDKELVLVDYQDNKEDKLNRELDELNKLLDSELTETHSLVSGQVSNEAGVSPQTSLNERPAFGKKNIFHKDSASGSDVSNEIKDLLEAGKKFYMKNRHSEAMQKFQKVLELDADNLVAIFNLGIIYVEREEQELAMKQFEKVLEIKPDDYKSLCNLGGIYYKLGKIKETKDILNRAIALNPNDINSIQNLKLIEKKLEYSRGK